MNKWKVKYMVFKAKCKMKVMYLFYRLKTIFRIKTFGYKQDYSLIMTKLLDKYKLPTHSVSLTRTSENLDTSDLFEIHKKGMRSDPSSYISIILNTDQKQACILVGEKLSIYLSQTEILLIQQSMQAKMYANEVISAVELGLKEIQKNFKVNQ